MAQGGRPAGRGQRAEEEEARFDKQAVAEGRRQFSSTVHPGAATSIYLYSCLSEEVCASAPPAGGVGALQGGPLVLAAAAAGFSP